MGSISRPIGWQKFETCPDWGASSLSAFHLPPTALFLWEAEEWSAERVDYGKAIHHLPVGQVFGVDPVAAEGQSGGDDCAVPE